MANPNTAFRLYRVSKPLKPNQHVPDYGTLIHTDNENQLIFGKMEGGHPKIEYIKDKNAVYTYGLVLKNNWISQNPLIPDLLNIGAEVMIFSGDDPRRRMSARITDVHTIHPDNYLKCVEQYAISEAKRDEAVRKLSIRFNGKLADARQEVQQAAESYANAIKAMEEMAVYVGMKIEEAKKSPDLPELANLEALLLKSK